MAYTIVYEKGQPASIVCFSCGFVSYNQNDIENRYCGRCHLFHDDEARKQTLKTYAIIPSRANSAPNQEGN